MKYRVYGNHPVQGWVSRYAVNEDDMQSCIESLKSQGCTEIGVQVLDGQEE